MFEARALFLIGVIHVACVCMAWARCPYDVCKCYSDADGGWIECANRGLESLPALNTGSDVDTVSMLALENNRITQISDNSLPPNLTYILFSRNPITEISPDAFAASANSLRGLWFQNANFTGLPGALLRLTNLTELHLYSTMITDWNDAVLTHIGNTLQDLQLSNVGLTSWPQWFQKLTSLTSIDLSQDAITQIPEDAFTHLKDKLTGITITKANLSEVPKGLMQLTALRRVDLSGNNINFLSNIPKIYYLQLSQNKISNATHLAEALLSTADTLTSLVLKSNQLTVIPDVSKLSNLTTVDLSQNLISDHTMGSFPPSVTTLNLQSNKLSSLPSALKSINNLKTLYLINNSVSEITPGSLPEQISTLQLSQNKISEIMPGTFPAQLSTLDLSYNNITEITPGSIPENLLQLDLKYNAINEIADNSFPDNSSLRTLDLSGNPISNITRLAFQPLQELKDLDLSGIKLTEIPRAFLSLTGLSELDIDYIPTLTCPCPIDVELRQWFLEQNKKFSTLVVTGGMCSDRPALVSYYIFAFQCPADTTPKASVTSSPRSGNGNLAAPLAGSWSLCFRMMVVVFGVLLVFS